MAEAKPLKDKRRYLKTIRDQKATITQYEKALDSAMRLLSSLNQGNIADRKRIEELEIFDGNDDHPENRCEKCRGRNLHNWYANSDIWNQVTQDKWSILCPNCFVELAREVGIDPSAWRISCEGDAPEINKCRVKIADQAATIEKGTDRIHTLEKAAVNTERRIEELEDENRELELKLINLGKQYRELSKHPDSADQTATIERLRGVCEKSIAYDKAIQEHASQGKPWVESDELDRLYDEWITAARQGLDTGRE